MPMSPSQFLPASLTSSPGRRSAGGNTPAASSSHTRPEAVMTSAARNPSSVRGVASNTSDMYQRSVVVEGVPSYPERRAVEDHRPPVRSPSPFLPSTVQSRLPTRGLNDDEVWWVVLEGAQPGAYLGRKNFCLYATVEISLCPSCRRAALSAAGDGLQPIVVKKLTTICMLLLHLGKR